MNDLLSAVVTFFLILLAFICSTIDVWSLALYLWPYLAALAGAILVVGGSALAWLRYRQAEAYQRARIDRLVDRAERRTAAVCAKAIRRIETASKRE